MAGTKITGLASGTTKSTDVHVAVDTTDTSMAPSGTDKKYLLSDLKTFINTNAIINGLTVDNVVIGGITPGAGTFSTLDSPSVTLTGGAIDGIEIGAGVPAPGHFTTLTAAVIRDTGMAPTAGVVHNDTLGSFFSNLIVNADITNNTILNAKLGQAPTLTMLGNNTGSMANLAYLSVPQINAMLGVPVVSLNEGEIGFGNSGGSVVGDFNLTWDNTAKGMLIGDNALGPLEASAILQINSHTKLFYEPRMNTTERLSSSPVEGAQCYDTTLHQWFGWNGTAWSILG